MTKTHEEISDCSGSLRERMISSKERMARRARCGHCGRRVGFVTPYPTTFAVLARHKPAKLLSGKGQKS